MLQGSFLSAIKICWHIFPAAISLSHLSSHFHWQSSVYCLFSHIAGDDGLVMLAVCCKRMAGIVAVVAINATYVWLEDTINFVAFDDIFPCTKTKIERGEKHIYATCGCVHTSNRNNTNFSGHCWWCCRRCFCCFYSGSSLHKIWFIIYCVNTFYHQNATELYAFEPYTLVRIRQTKRTVWNLHSCATTTVNCLALINLCLCGAENIIFEWNENQKILLREFGSTRFWLSDKMFLVCRLWYSSGAETDTLTFMRLFKWFMFHSIFFFF